MLCSSEQRVNEGIVVLANKGLIEGIVVLVNKGLMKQ